MRSRRRNLWIALAVLLVLGAIVIAVLLRKRAAPDAVRLLPDADAILYVNLEPVRLLTDLGKNPPKNREPEYEDFVRQTGFEFERDLNHAALAIHYANTPRNPATETRYSEIMQGQFDSQKVSDYLRKQSKSVEQYNGFEIYVIPLEGRTVRVVLLGIGMAAASNTEGTGAIHGMVDRYKQAALPFAGPGTRSRILSSRPPRQLGVDHRSHSVQQPTAGSQRTVAARLVEQPASPRQCCDRLRPSPRRLASSRPGHHPERH